MTADLHVQIGDISLKNPVICGSGEHVITPSGVRAALKAGAGAVIAKSTSESDAARAQLDRTDYLQLGPELDPLPWDQDYEAEAHLFCRSGLSPLKPEPWFTQIAELDEEARQQDAYVAASIIPADFDHALELAKFADGLGIRLLEFNIGAPHSGEAASGAITVEKNADRVREMTARLRDAVGMNIWIKLTGLSDDVPALAAAAKAGGADAAVMMGRSMAFLPDLDTMAPLLGTNAGYGGRWSLPITCRWLATSRHLLGADFPILGTNGARDGRDVARMMLSGARAVEMTSAILTGGFGVITQSLADLQAYLDEKQVDAKNIIGVAADRQQSYAEQDWRPDYWQEFVPPETLERS